MTLKARISTTLGALTIFAAACGVETGSKDAALETPSEADDAEVTSEANGPTLLGRIEDGQTLEGAFSRRASQLAWSFRAEQGSTIKLWARGVRPQDLDTVLLLYKASRTGRPTGSRLAINDDFGGELSSYIELEALETRDYAAVVRRYDRGTSGTVSLRLEIAGAVVHCGGIAGIGCAEGQFCLYQPSEMCGAADQMGVCTDIPTICTREYRPVCGCDGRTHGNPCSAHAAGTSIAHDGACAEPPQGECQVGGCSGQLCYDPATGGGISTCEWRAEYQCYRGATCARQADGQCGWTQTPELQQCLDRFENDCRSTGCGAGHECQFCWGSFQCIPEGAVC